ncbi:hypothetical protein [Pseudomonas asplenii]|uniref:hypothetical protein n=1 Tax=Pseudomonas asplenii TaxID=53407 RepID=UPI00223427FC|nr:hypothetical protein [Pseudomonas asplenii]UZE28162.1 hypothetical protein LOY63_22945 [Pseudomonas asplenii]
MDMQVKVEILEPGDQVLGFSENRLAIKKQTGELEIVTLKFDENNVPRIDAMSVLITYKSTKSKKASIVDKKSSFEVGSF